MKQVNMHEAKTQLSRLVEEVEAGEEVVIARAGKAVAKLVPIPTERTRRRLGVMRGQIWYAPDWDSDETNEAIAKLFYGDE